MRLRRHRADVKYLESSKGMDLDIARRYLNLIRMAEANFDYIASLQWAGNPVEYRKWEKRVLKDAEGK